jgi:hypothetical protein
MSSGCASIGGAVANSVIFGGELSVLHDPRKTTIEEFNRELRRTVNKTMENLHEKAKYK